jgi:hypothetical protein
LNSEAAISSIVSSVAARPGSSANFSVHFCCIIVAMTAVEQQRLVTEEKTPASRGILTKTFDEKQRQSRS